MSTSAVGFNDTSLWEKTIRKGDIEIEKLIDKRLENTDVTVVCVTYGTNLGKPINYEIDRSLERGNGLVAIQIHHIEDKNFHTDSPGIIPAQIKANGFKSYRYNDEEALARWITEAAGIASRQKNTLRKVS
jgi:hypothetical protein